MPYSAATCAISVEVGLSKSTQKTLARSASASPDLLYVHST